VSPQLFLGAALIGMAVGYLSGAFGKGGSAVATPLLHLLGVPAMVAIASPLPATIPSSLLAGRVYAGAGNVDRRVVRIGLPLGLLLTVVGAVLTRWVPGGPRLVYRERNRTPGAEFPSILPYLAKWLVWLGKIVNSADGRPPRGYTQTRRSREARRSRGGLPSQERTS